MFDLTRPTTWMNVANDIEYLQGLRRPTPPFGSSETKSNLATEEQLAAVKAVDISVPWNILTSAKTGENVEALFVDIAKEII